jgi:tetratricopeptide (TPR) repeat protein
LKTARQAFLAGLLALSGCVATEPRRAMSSAEEAFRQGRYAEAERRGQSALAKAEQAKDLSAVGEAAGFLAALRMLQGRSAQAEGLYRKALASFEKADPGGAAEAATAYNLAGVMSLQGDGTEAEALYKKALQLSERARVPTAELFDRLGGVGLFYESRKRFDEAEIYYKRALQLAEKLTQAHIKQAKDDYVGLVERKAKKR